MTIKVERSVLFFSTRRQLKGRIEERQDVRSKWSLRTERVCLWYQTKISCIRTFQIIKKVHQTKGQQALFNLLQSQSGIILKGNMIKLIINLKKMCKQRKIIWFQQSLCKFRDFHAFHKMLSILNLSRVGNWTFFNTFWKQGQVQYEIGFFRQLIEISWKGLTNFVNLYIRL